MEQLADYFKVPKEVLVDERKFAKRQSALSNIELEMMVIANLKQKDIDSSQKELDYRLDSLEKKKEKQIRIIWLTSLLKRNNPEIMAKIDNFLDNLELEYKI